MYHNRMATTTTTYFKPMERDDEKAVQYEINNC